MPKVSSFLIGVGVVILFASLTILSLVYIPLIRTELGYYFFRPDTKVEVFGKTSTHKPNVIYAKDDNFGIVVPKIGANSRIVPQVDPYNANIYQVALTKGVAQALGSPAPGHPGNIFLFAHSSENFYEALQYNSVFYLLNKLEKGDKVYIFYLKKKFVYVITDKQIVEAANVAYLSKKTPDQTLTLMTCWPAGTNYKRLLVNGVLKQQTN